MGRYSKETLRGSGQAGTESAQAKEAIRDDRCVGPVQVL
jgi:hypothetical protein